MFYSYLLFYKNLLNILKNWHCASPSSRALFSFRHTPTLCALIVRVSLLLYFQTMILFYDGCECCCFLTINYQEVSTTVTSGCIRRYDIFFFNLSDTPNLCFYSRAFAWENSNVKYFRIFVFQTLLLRSRAR